MSSPDFFREHGFFIETQFLDAAACARIRGDVREGNTEKCLLIKESSSEEVLDEDHRRSLKVLVKEPAETMVADKLRAFKLRLEKHFALSLKDLQKPNFLRYVSGSFCKPHRDAVGEAAAKLPVTTIIFLNAPSMPSPADGFEGGSLHFYGLLDGPAWEGCSSSLDYGPGMLVAFRSNIVHEVRPVTSGERFTIVAWFKG
ncbi:MAG: 2OG-Fe(II) oxygenase [Elusimicrobiota bacterium]